MKPCKECGKDVSTSAKTCPNCGKQHPSGGLTGPAKIFLGIILLLALISFMGRCVGNVSKFAAQEDNVSTSSHSEKFNKMTATQHLGFAKDAFAKNAIGAAKMHIDAIPSSAPEYKAAKELSVKIDKSINSGNAALNKPVKRKSNKSKIHPNSASERDYDNLTTYAIIMGRAVACGEDISNSSELVGNWLDRTFPAEEINAQVLVYAAAITNAAEQQHSGNTPDSCESAIRAFKNTRWP